MIIILFIGMFIGKMLNILSYKIITEKDILSKNIYCRKCNSILPMVEYLPILSYFFSKGYYSCCNNKKSLRELLIELLHGIIFASIYYNYGLSMEFFKYCTFLTYLMLVAIIDIDTTDIYTSITLIEIVFSCVFIMIDLLNRNIVINYLIAAAIGFGFIALIILVSKGMGWGDADVIMLVGLNLGIEMLINVIVFSFLIAGVLGAIFLLRKYKKKYIPFTPFILVGAIISILGGYII